MLQARNVAGRSPKQLLFEQFALVGKTLGHAHRLELLEQLAQGERSVEELAAKTGLSIANASQHLQRMARAGLVASRREGKFVRYRLSGNTVLDALAALRRLLRPTLPKSGVWFAAISTSATAWKRYPA